MPTWTPDEIWKMPNVVEHVNQIERSMTFGRAVVDKVQENCSRVGQIGSPLEAIFAVWFEAHLFAYRSMTPMHCEIVLVPQHVAHCCDGMIYRLDFMIGAVFPANLERVASRLEVPLFPMIGVELDGHDFHEKTKEQVTYRNQRDRTLQQTGWFVFHVSGSELNAKPAVIVQEILNYAINQTSEFYRRFGAKLLDAVPARRREG